jgi:hypothetical protein
MSPSAPSRDIATLEPDQFVHELGKPLWLPLGPPDLQREVLAFHVAELAQSLAERLQEWIRSRRRMAGTEPTDPVHIHRRLGVAGVRRHEKAEDQGNEQPTVMSRMVISFFDLVHLRRYRDRSRLI